jgi:O-antigen/teichoic acid export membrane protein
MRAGLTDAVWASAVQWARVGIGGVVFLIAARTLPLAEIGAFATAAAPLRFLQVIHKGGIEDAAVTTAPNDSASLATLHRLSLWLGLLAALAALAAAPLLDLLSPGAQIAPMVAILAATSLFHGLSAVPDGILRRQGRFRALALRTFMGQLAAAAIGLTALSLDAGVWALVLFTIAQATIAAMVALALTGWPSGPIGPLRPVAARVWPLAARVMVGGLVQPLLQVAIGATAGLAAAGIWQIATRVIGLLEALTIVPLRFIALPRLSKGDSRIDPLLTAASLSGVWVMGGTALAAPALVTALLGPDGAPVTTTLRLLCTGAVAGGGVAILNQAMIGAGRGPDVLRISTIAALAATLAGLATLALSPAPEALALSQIVAGLVPLALLLRASHAQGTHLTTLLRPWLALAPMALATTAAAYATADLSPATVFAAQALTGTAALALSLPLVAPSLLRRAP